MAEKRVIWKVELSVHTKSITIPEVSGLLCIKVQRNTPCMWFVCDPESKMQTVSIEILPTGQPFTMDDGIRMDYMGTFMLADDHLVFHVFQKVKQNRHIQ